MADEPKGRPSGTDALVAITHARLASSEGRLQLLSEARVDALDPTAMRVRATRRAALDKLAALAETPAPKIGDPEWPKCRVCKSALFSPEIHQYGDICAACWLDEGK